MIYTSIPAMTITCMTLFEYKDVLLVGTTSITAGGATTAVFARPPTKCQVEALVKCTTITADLHTVKFIRITFPG